MTAARPEGYYPRWPEVNWDLAQERWERYRMDLVVARCHSCVGRHEFSPVDGTITVVVTGGGWAGCQEVLPGRWPEELLIASCQHAYECPAGTIKWTYCPCMGRSSLPGHPAIFGGFGPEWPWSPLASR